MRALRLFGNSLQLYAHNYTVIITATLLMLAGGLGFVTLYEFDCSNLSYDVTKNIITFPCKVNCIIWIIGWYFCNCTLIFFLERQHAFASLSPFANYYHQYFSCSFI